jgi:hypothetical protein
LNSEQLRRWDSCQAIELTIQAGQPLLEGHINQIAAHATTKAQEGPSTMTIVATPGLSKSLGIMAIDPTVRLFTFSARPETPSGPGTQSTCAARALSAS